MAAKTYENAIKILNSTRRKARPKVNIFSDATKTTSGISQTATLAGRPSLSGMRDWLQLLGHSDNDINCVNWIHVAGTKGKGSTCAFARSILRAHGSRTGFPRKVGMYTSPGLRCIRERIQINDQPISESLFAKYFFEVWERLYQETSNEEQLLPRYLQLLAITAFHTFIKERVGAAICEPHHGGEYDATNVIPQPVVTGVTSIGLDHVEQLGPTIENVAWHKAGIFKRGAPAFVSAQGEAVIGMMHARAAEKQVELKVVPADPRLPPNIPLLEVPVQRLNCSLALALVESFLQMKAPSNQRLITDDVVHSLNNFSWPGRFQVIPEGKNTWFLDGAHNELSMPVAAEWFCDLISRSPPSQAPSQVLVFGHLSEDRDGLQLLKLVAKSLSERNCRPQHVIFTTYQERIDGFVRFDCAVKIPQVPTSEVLSSYVQFWTEVDPGANVTIEPTIEQAIRSARQIGGENDKTHQRQILITGSLYLVGGALNVLGPID